MSHQRKKAELGNKVSAGKLRELKRVYPVGRGSIRQEERIGSWEVISELELIKFW